ncbi:MAG: TRM11 family SAM-dependent methyltransferase, partial [Candidatus Dormibacteria bacterium]
MPQAGTVQLHATRESNKLRAEDYFIHDWYRFILSYPPHLVRSYIERFGVSPSEVVLDPFCGTGTTLVECKKLGLQSVGIEANPMPCFATRIKIDWSVNPDYLLRHAQKIANIAADKLGADGLDEVEGLPLFSTRTNRVLRSVRLRTLSPETEDLLLTDSISPLPLHRTLTLLDVLRDMRDDRFSRYEKLALAKALVFGIGNLEFGPEVGVGRPKPDAPAIMIWLRAIKSMVDDLRTVDGGPNVSGIVHHSDARQMHTVLKPE